MKRIIYLLLALIILSSTPAYSAILVFSQNGSYVTKTSLAVASTSADCVGKRIVVTAPITLTTAVNITGCQFSVEGTGQISYSGSGALTFGAGSVSSVNPDWFAGNDSLRTQNAVICALASGVLPLSVNRQFTLTIPVNIDRLVDTCTSNFRIIGNGPNAGFYTSAAINMFSSTLTSVFQYGYYPLVTEKVNFEGIRFESSASTINNYVIDGSKYLRTSFLNCSFKRIRLMYATSYLQSIYIQGGDLYGLQGVFIDIEGPTPGVVVGTIGDLKIHGLDVEAGEGGVSELVKCNSIIAGSDISGNTAESISGPLVEAADYYGVNLSANYAEMLTNPVYRLGNAHGVSIHGNVFSTYPYVSSYYAIDAQTAVNIDSGGNWSYGNLYDQRNMPNGGVGLNSAGDFSQYGYTQNVMNWVPIATNLTIVPGTGGVTLSGAYRVSGKILFWTIAITATGTATHASTVGITSFTLPATLMSGVSTSCSVVNITTGVGMASGYTFPGSVGTPTWAATGNQIIVSGVSILQ